MQRPRNFGGDQWSGLHLLTHDPWCRGEESVEQVRMEASEKAVEAREAAVRPLRAELGRMRMALTDLQSAYSSDIAQASIPQ